jgi:hypothetical protein
MKKKYSSTKQSARKAKNERIEKGEPGLQVFKMPKGTRYTGKFAVCTEIEYLNTY